MQMASIHAALRPCSEFVARHSTSGRPSAAPTHNSSEQRSAVADEAPRPPINISMPTLTVLAAAPCCAQAGLAMAQHRPSTNSMAR